MNKDYLLKDVTIQVDAREDDSVNSWIAAQPYGKVLEDARNSCPTDRHIMTLAEYIGLWRGTVQEMGSRACNEADVWAKFQTDRDEENPLSFVRHPFLSTVLVDTYLTDFSEINGEYEAMVVVGGKPQKRITLPKTGKIYEVNEFGLPSKTGGKKIKASDTFEHRWWAFSSDQIRNTDGSIKKDFKMTLFGNGGTIGCFCELIKAHYEMNDAGGFYRILSLPNK